MNHQASETSLPGVLIVDVAAAKDQRGFFYEAYRHDRYTALGIPDVFVQDNHSQSVRGVLRGIHYQDMSAPMAKLVRCTRGAVLDVAVDLRIGSPTFGKWVAVTLSAVNRRQLYVPVGFGHGFVAMSAVAEIQYKCSSLYQPAAEGTIAWNDPDLGIEWGVNAPVLSAKDERGMRLADYVNNPAFRYPVA